MTLERVATKQATIDRKFSLSPPSFEEEKESIILGYTKISFIDEIIVFKTPHDILGKIGFNCHGTVTTFAKFNDNKKIEFDMFNVICNQCYIRPIVMEYKGAKAKALVEDELFLYQKTNLKN